MGCLFGRAHGFSVHLGVRWTCCSWPLGRWRVCAPARLDLRKFCCGFSRRVGLVLLVLSFSRCLPGDSCLLLFLVDVKSCSSLSEVASAHGQSVRGAAVRACVPPEHWPSCSPRTRLFGRAGDPLGLYCNSIFHFLWHPPLDIQFLSRILSGF